MSNASGPTVAGIRISHPDRVVFPDLGLSKLQLARYYDDIGRWILPHIRNRPLTLVHCPAGIAAPCSYMKHAKAWGPTALRRVNIQEKTKVGEYLVADSISAIVALAQMGVVEIHTWNSTSDNIDRPDRLVWDLDPGPAIEWTQTIAAARLLRQLLETFGLDAWIKTTGGTGLHIVVPIATTMTWSDCLAFSRGIAEALVSTNAALYTTAFRKRGREDKILIDYLRNNRTNTSICAYSPRARPGASVSMPIAWRELRATPQHWTPSAAVARLRALRADPWEGYWRSAQRVSRSWIRALQEL